MPVLRSTRRRTAALTAAVALAYGAGLLSGNAPARPSATPAPAPSGGSPVADLTASAKAGAQTLDRAAVQALLDKLDDRWAAYLDPAEYARFEQAIDGHYTGVGVFVRRGGATNDVSVSSVQPGSPADRAGLAVGDVIRAVDGANVDPLTIAAVTNRLRGEAGTPVTVTVVHRGTAREVTMTRVVMADADVTTVRMHDGVTKITVSSFTRGVGKKVRAAVAGASGGGIVLDLRGNPGGLLQEAVEVASAFFDGGPVVTYVPSNGAPQELDAIGTGDTTVPLVVLVDGGTASAAEVVAAALQDRGRAAIIGSETFGKGTVQQPLRLGDGAGVEFTVGTYRTPNGRSVDGVGLTPDIQVAGGSSPSVALARAAAVLTGLMADARTAGRG
ncbi:MAG: carboxyl-terminal processing protease [Frankiaceae bacterium]|nr:carboxyl-terminal processing protease [Frankiaceae bacterium]